ncbi:monovalent cation:proton antiporter-2 (CPA2) family protein [Campylobacter sputorum subsp. bubulus]|uniref:Monovalent cation:proton antiporter-2 (CPA2) family protein n=1 Tax=Campylobacter sputorum subsp. sputorum TaxID=32024 RepID=A0A381DIS1_9BACT|nr:cation:proton antiporter [Campylobacter sputorum]ASM35458.1 Na+/H+ exchanger family protein [Campylobacter sputorum aubsp. sputorum RM3237]KAB0582803.1 cation:proton antiporter [Campylobacter sputorum subsp. sputorum]QEL05650.1 sodium:proton exchanger family protein [Campylobacter sputorum subsp. sputorum]SUX08439.1 monovalent cation:proton antiporter-2 (CPA2) family protein [Campylobacter sputorum subsp. bubulus]SUX10417.1 monovalent cation:proton antiporter-2 (CPA2) family protein [Campyl
MFEFGITTLLLLLTLAFIIISSPFFSKISKMPIASVEIILGAIAGYFGLINDNDMLKLVANVGFYFLMFLAGSEVNLKVFLNADKDILKKTFAYLFILYVISVTTTFGFNLNILFLIILPIMSVGLLSTLYKDYGKNEEWLNISMLIGSIGEIISIALLTFLSSYLEFGMGIQLYSSIGYLIAFLLLCVAIYKFTDVLFWWFPKIKVILMPQNDKEEQDIRLCMALFFSIISVMLWLKMEIAFGAFVAGIFIATFFDHKKDLTQKLSSVGYGFLVPVFFIHLGSTFKLESLLSVDIVEYAIIVSIALIMLRFVSSIAFFKFIGFKNSILISFSHSMPLTLLVATATIGYKSKYINYDEYSGLILASLLSAIIALNAIKLIMSYKK